jgi:hypothetical protein
LRLNIKDIFSVLFSHISLKKIKLEGINLGELELECIAETSIKSCNTKTFCSNIMNLGKISEELLKNIREHFESNGLILEGF